MLRRFDFCLVPLGLCLGLLTCSHPVRADDAKTTNDKVKEVAGTAEFLRAVPKRFGILKGVDAAHQRVTLLIDGESLPKVWSLAADAEVKRNGWWGRINQFKAEERVWVWFQVNRQRQPVAISMLADEMSEQDIHAAGMTLEARDKDTITLKVGPAKPRVHQTPGAEVYLGDRKTDLDSLKIGAKVFVQTSNDRAKVILDEAAFEARRTAQQAVLRQRWIDEGLPGAVAFLHQFGGEMDYMLDHEAMRWGRSLKTGDKVTLQVSPPIVGVVKTVRPWRERTQLRLVVNSFDQADLTVGQRVRLKMTAPSAELDKAQLPADLDRPRSKEERVEWFLSSIYCTCKVKGDSCTGHFYTLSSCNVNACGMPNAMRKTIAGKIDKGLNDKQIFEELLKEQGPDLLRQHLLQ